MGIIRDWPQKAGGEWGLKETSSVSMGPWHQETLGPSDHEIMGTWDHDTTGPPVPLTTPLVSRPRSRRASLEAVRSAVERTRFGAIAKPSNDSMGGGKKSCCDLTIMKWSP